MKSQKNTIKNPPELIKDYKKVHLADSWKNFGRVPLWTDKRGYGGQAGACVCCVDSWRPATNAANIDTNRLGVFVRLMGHITVHKCSPCSAHCPHELRESRALNTQHCGQFRAPRSYQIESKRLNLI